MSGQINREVIAEVFDVRMLNPDVVTLRRSKGGVLQGTIACKEYNEIVVTRAFPMSKPNEYVSFGQPDGTEIGIVKDLSTLDTISLAEVQLELRTRYLVPVVQRIDKITEEPGFWMWDVQTDRGPLQLVMRNLHEHVHPASGGRLLITDMNGRRCEITDTSKLDAHSRQQLSKIG